MLVLGSLDSEYSRIGVGKSSPWVKSSLLSNVINKILWVSIHSHLFIIYSCFCITIAELSSQDRDLHGPKSLKYLLSGPLQKKKIEKFADLCFRVQTSTVQ